MLVGVLAVAVVAFVVGGAVAVTRPDGKKAAAQDSSGPRSGAPRPVVDAPSWAVDQRAADAGVVAPSVAAVALLCQGVPLPGELGAAARSGRRTVPYFWSRDLTHPGATNVFRGGGAVPGPTHEVAFDTFTTHLTSLVGRGPIGWVVCVTPVDLGPGTRVTYVFGQAGVWETPPDPSVAQVVVWHTHSLWRLDLREAATGKLLARTQLEARGNAPQTLSVETDSSRPPPDLGPEPTRAQIDSFVHDALG